MSELTLTLLRHAKSSWQDQHQSDKDRPLNERGNRDAPVMAQRLVSRHSIPEIIFCSAAVRTRQTTDHLLKIFGKHAPEVQYMKSLYLASPTKLLHALNDVPQQMKHVMLVAHNPGIEDLSALLQGEHYDTMPTCAIRQFSCNSFAALASCLEESSTIAPPARLIYSDSPKQPQ